MGGGPVSGMYTREREGVKKEVVMCGLCSVARTCVGAALRRLLLCVLSVSAFSSLLRFLSSLCPLPALSEAEGWPLCALCGKSVSSSPLFSAPSASPLRTLR